MRQSLDSLSGTTPLQVRHELKNNWDTWVEVVNEKNLYKTLDEIITTKYTKNIKVISKIKPCEIEIPDINTKDNIEFVYNKIIESMKGCESLTINALLWATLCDKSGNRMRLDKYIQLSNKDYIRDLVEMYEIINQDDTMDESFDLNKILQTIGFTFTKEKGLIQILRDAGQHMFSLFKALLIAWYTGKEEDKQAIKDIIDETKITKEHVVDFLFKLDEATIHLLTGPIYILSAVTGWKIRPKSPHNNVSSIESKIKDALDKLNAVVGELPKKVSKNFKSYLRGMERLICKELELCGE